MSTDEPPRPATTVEGLAALKTAFEPDGTITAGNAPGVNDGASALILMSAARAAVLGLAPLARVVSWGEAALEPQAHGRRPGRRHAKGA